VISWIASLLILLGHPASAEEALMGDGQPARATVGRIDTPPRIDGRLDDAVWSRIEPIGDFTQVEPREGVAPTFQTEVRLAHDGRFIYIAARCWDDDPSAIIAKKLARDAELDSDDRVTFLFDTFHDRRNGFMFQVNANGARLDGLTESNRVFRREWDGIWDGKTAIDGEGWTAELRIPLQTLNFDPEGTTWGFNAMRVIRRFNERTRWTNFAQNRSFLDLANGGVLTGLSGLEQGLGLDVVTSGTVTQQHEHPSSRDFTALDPSLDIFYKLTPGITGVATFNTDFAENFADERQINITRFENFFPETRDFFLQDAGIFEGFGGLTENGRPYFSRRIGLFIEDIGVSEPDPVEIRGGLKISGREGPLNVGLLGAHTDSIGAVERKNLLVARMSYNVLEESTVGIVATRGDPSQNRDNHLFGADFRYRNSNMFGNQVVTADLWVQRSSTSDLAGDSLAWGAVLEYPNDRWDVLLGVQELEANFLPGLGFVNRVGIRRYDAEIRRRWRPRNWLRTADTLFDGQVTTGDGSEIQSSRLLWRIFDLANQAGDSFNVEVIRRTEELEVPFEIAEGVTLLPQRQSWWGNKWTVETADLRPVNLVLEFAWGKFWNGDLVLWRGTLGLRPSKHFTASVFYEEFDVHLTEGDFTKRLLRVRTTVGINPDLSLESLTQYDNVSRSIGFQTRLHWIVQPGDDLYLIFGQDFDADGDRIRGTRTRGIGKIAWTHRF
jgi:hypothetical protein